MKELVLSSVWDKAGFHNIISFGFPITENESGAITPSVYSFYKDINVSPRNHLEQLPSFSTWQLFGTLFFPYNILGR